MQPPGPRRAPWLVSLAPIFPLCVLAGCASPGAPRPPSLQLPEPVRDLAAVRSGDDVQLQFTASTRTTDDLPLRAPTLHGRVCRQEEVRGPCQPVPPAELTFPAGTDTVPVGGAASWEDRLPAALRQGSARAIRYRVELRREDGQSAGFSDAAVVAAGAAPPSVAQFAAQGTRRGVLLQWQPTPDGGEILIERRQLDQLPGAARPEAQKGQAPEPAPGARHRPERKISSQSREPGLTWFQADPGNGSAARTLDATAAEGVHYRYAAVRRRVVQAGGRTLELRSAPSSPVEVVWRNVYPPLAPQDLTAVGFQGPDSPAGTSSTYAVDLVWQPVSDSGLAGYRVRRTALNPAGEPEGAPQELTATPVVIPAFHDAAAQPAVDYRYEVTAVDAKGNSSAPATVMLRARQP